jgi:UDP-N-acetyl-D-glucosamine dehydrogenase
MAYKKDIADYRESSAAKLFELLQKRGADTCFHDPFVPQLKDHHGNVIAESVDLDDAVLAEADAVLIATDHTSFDWDRIREHATLVVDYRNVYPSSLRSDSLWKL